MKYLKQYRALHAAHRFSGKSLKKHISTIASLLQQTQSKTLLDYGCGGAKCHQIGKTDHWGVAVTLYDPAVKGYDKLPAGPFDAVICTDVLEHVPEDELDETLNNIFSRATKFVFLSISTKPANKKFDDGTNVHVTIKPSEWWLAKVESHAKRNGLHTYHVVFD